MDLQAYQDFLAKHFNGSGLEAQTLRFGLKASLKEYRNKRKAKKEVAMRRLCDTLIYLLLILKESHISVSDVERDNNKVCGENVDICIEKFLKKESVQHAQELLDALKYAALNYGFSISDCVIYGYRYCGECYELAQIANS